MDLCRNENIISRKCYEKGRKITFCKFLMDNYGTRDVHDQIIQANWIENVPKINSIQSRVWD